LWSPGIRSGDGSAGVDAANSDAETDRLTPAGARYKGDSILSGCWLISVDLPTEIVSGRQ
jgi:hypothetical protein